MADTGPFQVVLLGEVREQLKGYARRAGALGILGAFTAAVRDITGRLENDPVDWGDPAFRLPHLGLLLCRGPHPLLHVHYGVDEVRRIVYVKEFRPAPGSPLAQ